MTSLGFRAGHDHIAERPRAMPRPMAPEPLALPAPSRSRLPTVKMPTIPMPFTPKGFLPLLFYSAASVLFPLLLLFMTYDFTDNVVRGLFIGVAALFAFVPVISNDCCVLYNTVLFFHTGIEVKVIQTAFDYAMAADTPDYGMVLGYVGAITVIVHLVPFFLTDHPMLVSLLAVVGVPVNAAIALFLDKSLGESMFLLVLLSSYAFLVTARIVLRLNEETPSMLTQLRKAMDEGSWIKCSA